MAIQLKLKNLLYVIHAVDPARVRGLCPAGIELDIRETPEGPRAFLATVTLESGAAFPYIVSGFRQVNYRLYVRHDDEQGVLVVRSWVSARATAAVLSLAVPTEHASIDLTIGHDGRPFSQYTARAHSAGHDLEIDAESDAEAPFPLFATREEAVHFLTHRLKAFVAGAHPKNELSVIRVKHSPMNPLHARVTHMRADQWTDAGILTAEEASRPMLALIQPDIPFFDMELPEKIA